MEQNLLLFIGYTDIKKKCTDTFFVIFSLTSKFCFAIAVAAAARLK